MKKVILMGAACLSIGAVLMGFIPKKTTSKLTSRKEFTELYAYVPATTVTINGQATTTKATYMAKYEVSNEAYNAFLTTLKATETEESMAKLMPKVELWSTLFGADAYAKFYHSNAAYNSYPAVNITYEQAVAYCAYLTKTANKRAAELNDQLKYTFRLPTRAEWIAAALGGKKACDYAWGGPEVKNKKGMMLCNCKKTSNGATENNNSDVTAPVKAYFPNDIGLYNMNGNVAEMIAENGKAVGGSWLSTEAEVTNESIMYYNMAAPSVGFRPVMEISSK